MKTIKAEAQTISKPALNHYELLAYTKLLFQTCQPLDLLKEAVA